MRQTRCVGCNAMGRKTDRPAYRPGPRCDECWRLEKKKRSKVAHGRRIEKVYAITTEIYDAIYEAQGGKCFVCQRATGKTKRLAVDHDHDCEDNWNNTEGGHDPKMGCPKCIRCLACGPCNKDLLGRYDADALMRAKTVLTDPPAQKVLKVLLRQGDSVDIPN